MKKLLVSEDLLNKIINYLAVQRYADVYQQIHGLQQIPPATKEELESLLNDLEGVGDK